MARRARQLLAASILSATLIVGLSAPASATIHEMVASFCSGGSGNLFPPGQSKFGTPSFLKALQASGTVRVLFDTPVAGAITIDYLDSPAGKFASTQTFVEAIPGIWVEVLTPDHPAFEHCTKFAFSG